MYSSLTKKIGGFLMMSAMVLMIFSSLAIPRKSEAAIFCVKGIISFGPEVPTSDADARMHLKGDCIKEWVMDTVVWPLVDKLIEQMTSSIVNWINSGFNGSPAFVQNLKAHFEDLQNEIFGNLMKTIAVPDFLCSSFSAKIKNTFQLRLDLAKSRPGTGSGADFTFKNEAKCGIDDALKNVNSSIKDFQNDFSNGSWPAWMLTINPDQNEYGAYININEELWRTKGEAKDNRAKELNYGRGFLSWPKKCSQYDTESGGPPTGNEGFDVDGEGPVANGGFSGECVDPNAGKIMTPGSAIQDRLSKALGAGADRLNVADEIDEIASALVQQLIQQVLNKGLAGLSQGGSATDNSNRSFTDQLNASTTNTTRPANQLRSVLDGTINSISQYISFKQQTLSILQSFANTLQDLLACLQQTNNTSKIAETQGLLNSVQNEIDRIENEITSAQEDRQQLENFRNNISNNDDPARLEEISRLIADMEDSHDPAEAQGEMTKSQEQIAPQQNQAQQDLTQCRLENGLRGGTP